MIADPEQPTAKSVTEPAFEFEPERARVELPSGILIVDDNAANLLVARVTLGSYYQPVFTAKSGEEGLKLAREQRPDAILLDYMMPGMSGLDVLVALKAAPETRDIPVVFLSACSESDILSRGFRLGAVDFIKKPIQAEELRVRMRTHLTLSRQRHELNDLNNRLLSEIKGKEALLDKQRLDLALAKKAMAKALPPPDRHTPLNRKASLFCEFLTCSTQLLGGDHFLFENFEQQGRRKTCFSLKDQSGHEVNCMLRALETDLVHKSLLRQEQYTFADKIDILRGFLLEDGVFQNADFCTAVIGELDHQSLVLRMANLGHPPAFLIREDQVLLLPGPGSGDNLPLCCVESEELVSHEIQMQVGDRIILCTDGLFEMPLASRPRGEAWSPAFIGELIQGLLHKNPGTPVGRLLKDLLELLTEASGATFIPGIKNSTADDISLVGLEIEDPEPGFMRLLKPSSLEETSRIASRIATLLSRERRLKSFENIEGRLTGFLEEGLLNAFRHGNKQDPEKHITVQARIHNDLEIIISDQGTGFNPRLWKDPRLQPNRLAESGRGIFMMQYFAQGLRWNTWGNSVSGYFSPGENQGPHPISPLVRAFS